MGPAGGRNDATEVQALKAGVFERQNIIVDSAKRTIRTMLHSLIESLDDIRFEVIATRISIHNRLPLVFRELVIGKAQHVHLDARSD